VKILLKCALLSVLCLLPTTVVAQTWRSLATARGFTMGCGDTDPSIFNSDGTFNGLVAAQCNSIEPGNVMKQNAMEPSNGGYDFSQADLVMNYAAANSQSVTATAPVWDNASYGGGTPSWVSGLSSGALTTALQNYVNQFMTHMHTNYPGRMKQIALVSEASHQCPNGSYNPGYGTGPYCSILGPDTSSGSYASHVSGLTYFPEYVTVAYTQARASDPTAQLCYDDWGWEGSGASGYQYWLVAYLKHLGLVDCVGLEGQWQYNAIPTNVPSTGSISSTISAYQALGVTVYFSQVQLGIHTNGTNNNVPNTYTSTVPADLTTQASTYSALLGACLANTTACNAFYVWGISDKWAFIDAPSPYGVGAPQPYDASYNPKAAYTAIQTALASGGGTTYALSTATTGSGTGTVTGCAGNYAASVAYSCTVTPTGGSTLSSVTGCGGSGTTTYSGSMPASACTVTATFSSAGCTASRTAASLNPSDVLAALNAVNCPTSTVSLPAGHVAWSSAIAYTMPSVITSLTLQGATTLACTGTPATSGYSCTPTDNTIIEDAYLSNTSLITLYLTNSATSVMRITGITMQGGSAGGNSKYNGLIDVYSGSLQLRYDHDHCNMSTYSPTSTASVCLRTFGPVTGVADHNKIELAPNSGGFPTLQTFSFGFSIFGAYNDSIGNGDGTFSHPTPWGSLTSFYVESNVFIGGYTNDCGGAGAMVIRNNNTQGSYTQTHGTKSAAGPDRGCRMYEAYHNYITGPTSGIGPLDAVFGSKNATAMIWGNTLVNGFYRYTNLCTDRNSCETPETAPPNGWGYCGTVHGGSDSAWDGNNNVGSGWPCLDGIGRGQDTQALNGQAFPGRLNSITGTVAWSHQYLEPMYFFMNSGTPQAGVFAEVGSTDTTNNRDFYADCSASNAGCTGAFTGAAGTGYGLLSARPSTCTAGPGGTYATSPTGSYGVAYFATDVNGGLGGLYVCTATNTWSSTYIYTPAAYPHPLAGGTPQVNTPTATPIAPYTGTATTVALADTTPSAAICYTVDGSTPTAPTPGTCSGGTTALYTTPISVSSTTTINAIGTLAAYLNSAQFSGLYTISGSSVCGDPTQNGPNYSGTYNVPPTTLPLAVGFTSPTAGCVMHYTATTDGSTPAAPTCGDTTYPGGGFSITSGGTYIWRTIACQGGYTSSNIIGGTWTVSAPIPASLTVTVNGTGSGSVSSCPLGTSAPTVGSSVTCAGAPAAGSMVTSSGTGSAGACTGGGCTFTFNVTSTLTYTFIAQASPPLITPSTGTYTGVQTVSMTDSTPGAVMRYTLDGSTPTAGSTLYSGSFSVSVSTTVRAIAIASGYTNSGVGQSVITINSTCGNPTQLGPNFSGPYSSPPTTLPISIGYTSPTVGCNMFMTLDSSTPTCLSTAYAGQSISVTTTMKVLACQAGYTSSAVQSGTWSINPPAVTPLFSPVTGTYSGGTSVSISTATLGCSAYIYWATHTPPTTGDNHGITFFMTTPGTYYAKVISCPGYTDSSVGFATYSIPGAPALLIAVPAIE